ncbi:MAG: hypothetical protein U9R01_05795 [candidate division WOR-3 bacterium]|nr:hypothetical protein [candidate division WOR-3 bacterium]
MNADKQDKKFKYKELTTKIIPACRQAGKFSTGLITNWVTDFWKRYMKML